MPLSSLTHRSSLVFHTMTLSTPIRDASQARSSAAGCMASPDMRWTGHPEWRMRASPSARYGAHRAAGKRNRNAGREGHEYKHGGSVKATNGSRPANGPSSEPAKCALQHNVQCSTTCSAAQCALSSGTCRQHWTDSTGGRKGGGEPDGDEVWSMQTRHGLASCWPPC